MHRSKITAPIILYCTTKNAILLENISLVIKNIGKVSFV